MFWHACCVIYKATRELKMEEILKRLEKLKKKNAELLASHLNDNYIEVCTMNDYINWLESVE